MAKKKHRKLATETNKTLDCSIGICDPICPYNCYPEPDYYSISPQLPPWSSPNAITAPSISAVYQPSENEDSSSFEAITIITITGAVLAILLTGLFLVAKFVSASVSRVNHGRYERDEDDNDTVMEEDIEDREQVDHPIWLIRTTGLQQSIINSITICNYKRGDGLIERTDCPVCLSEFEEDESLRLLPKCNHAFHISCIDTWLRSHTNCPLCRAGIAMISAATPRCSVPVDVTPGGSGSHEENDGVGEEDHGQIENRDESEFKERDDSDNTDPNSDVRIDIYGSVEENNQVLEEIDGDGSETETKEQVKVLAECIEFVGKSCENQSQSFTRTETEKENKAIGDEASCSDENDGHNVQSLRGFDSDESNNEATEDTGTSQSDNSSETLKTTGSSSVSCFNKNKNLIFPL